LYERMLMDTDTRAMLAIKAANRAAGIPTSPRHGLRCAQAERS